jgi:hypothetical protein
MIAAIQAERGTLARLKRGSERQSHGGVEQRFKNLEANLSSTSAVLDLRQNLTPLS